MGGTEMMKAETRAGRVAGVYLLVALATIAYELSIRLYDRGNSEFAGMLSFALTLPSSIVMASASSRMAGVKVGDSDAAFVTILTVAAVVNSVVMFLVVRRLSRS
jgi:hypothetical protein